MLHSQKQQKKVKRIDKIFRRTILFAGISTILCVLAILWSILKVTFPLFQKGELEETPLSSFPNQTALVYFSPDNYLETVLGISEQGMVFLQNTSTKEIIAQDFLSVGKIEQLENDSPEEFFIRSELSSSLWQIASVKQFSSLGEKEYKLKAEKLAQFPKVEQNVFYDMIRQVEEENFVRVLLFDDKKISIHSQGMTTNFLGQEEVVEKNIQWQSSLSGKLQAAFLSKDAKNLYLANDSGELENISLEEDEIKSTFFKANQQDKKITGLNTIFGDTSLLISFEDGSLEIFSYVRKKLELLSSFQTASGSIKKIVASWRNKSFFVIGEKNSSFWYLTNNKRILTTNWNFIPQKIYFNPNGTALGVLQQGKASLWEIQAPHPDFSLASIFQKTKYEGYSRADYIWQSSSGNDDFEPKYSFIPLIIGSIKGTLYAMLFALPLAILGAIYVNQFSPPWLRNIVKPSVEVMATIPSVVIGFLAALWLAPIIEKHLLTIVIYFFLFPVFFVLSFFLLKKIARSFFYRSGIEFILVIPSLLFCLIFILLLAPLLQQSFFENDFIFWLSQTFGIVYEQRNAIIISFALGFAVIPIIFTMTDEALSSFPRSLSAASFALGANHWQTLVRVILPTTSSGIFAGFIIGFGRAIGETMIVLMATGNSPITSFSLFNGMRTLSANIAVEIPEAPLEGTLYRTLFLSAVLLFLLTFTLNLLAELIRNRLRKKYRIQ